MLTARLDDHEEKRKRKKPNVLLRPLISDDDRKKPTRLRPPLVKKDSFMLLFLPLVGLLFPALELTI